ncbi:MAG TPA: hypothetical protein VMR62_02680 [Bryobacteraceae bacterium]|nr:hypothetical protein [Bryobacteraceae bacterium]
MRRDLLRPFQGAVITLWRWESDLFLARVDGQPEERLATGKSPAVALRGNGIYAVWSGSEGIMGVRLIARTARVAFFIEDDGRL